jgi:PKD repeat protein
MGIFLRVLVAIKEDTSMSTRRNSASFLAAGIVFAALLVIAALAIIVPAQAQSGPQALEPLTLEAAKTVPHGDICATHNFWWYVVVTNTSTVPAASVVVTDTLPDGIYDVHVSEPGSFDGERQVIWNLGDLQPSASITVWIRAKALSTFGGECLTNEALIDADNLGVPVYVTATVCVYPLPEVEAVADRPQGCEPLTVQFTNRVLNGTPPFSYYWTFGDDSGTSSMPNPTYTYDSPGTYRATLRVVDALGCEGQDDVEITVYENPTVSVTANPTEGCEPLTVRFTSSASGGTPPYTYAWDFGDAAALAMRHPYHTYESAGTYTAELTVTDANGCTDTRTVEITVYPNPIVTVEADPTSGFAPLMVQFTGNVVSGTPPFSYAWDLGDGGSSTMQNPSHTYNSAGTYTATLSVTDSQGCTGEASVTVTVEPHDYNVYLPKVLKESCTGCCCQPCVFCEEFEPQLPDWDEDLHGVHRKESVSSVLHLWNAPGVITNTFPLLWRNDVFDQVGSDFCLWIRFRHERVTAYGTTVAVNSQAVDPDSALFVDRRVPHTVYLPDHGIEDILNIHHLYTEGGVKRFEVTMFGHRPDKVAWLGTPGDTGWHEVKVVLERGVYTLWVDDHRVGSAEANGLFPSSVYVGNPKTMEEWGTWTHLFVDYIRVGPLLCDAP